MFKKLSIFLLSLCTILACKKNETQVGVNVLPQSDVLGASYAEIIPSVSYSKFEDSVMTRFITNANLLGSVSDEVFGRTDASIYVNYEGTGPPGFGPNATLDSVVLSLHYTSSLSYVGDTSHPLNIDVFPLVDMMYRDSLYYSGRNLNYNKNYNLVDGGQSKKFTPNLHTLVHVGKDDQFYSTPQLNIKLRKEFGEMLFNAPMLYSLSALQNAFHGFFITTNHSEMVQPFYGSLFYVDMNASTLLLYYHDDLHQTATYPLTCGGNSTRFGHFDHDYRYVAAPKLSSQLYPAASADTLSTQNIFLQGLAGLKAKVEFPDLLKWTSKNIVINKAELVFQVDNSNANFFNVYTQPLPGRLYLEGQDPNTNLPMTLIENLYAFGGTFNSTTQQYIFEIPHTIKRIITGQLTTTSFFVSIYSNAIFPERVVLGGAGNPRYPIKLKLWYTSLNFPK